MAHGSLRIGARRPVAEAVTPVRIALTLALVAFAGGAQAQPYVPPGMALPDPTPTPTPPPTATSTSTSTSTSPCWEWGLGVVAGRRSGWWSPTATGDSGFGVTVEGQLLALPSDRLVLGAMLSSGLAVHVLAGTRFRLTPRLRLDLLADGGLTRQELSSTETYWAPTVGARAGIAWARPEGGRYLTLGVALRHAVPDRTVQVVCGSGATPCGRAELGGGTMIGAFLTYGGAHGAERRVAPPDR